MTFSYFSTRKKAPEEILGSLDFTVFLLNYSIIVATRPEPTVLPPSRISDSVIWGVLAYLPPLYSSYSPHNHDIFVVY